MLQPRVIKRVLAANTHEHHTVDQPYFVSYRCTCVCSSTDSTSGSDCATVHAHLRVFPQPSSMMDMNAMHGSSQTDDGVWLGITYCKVQPLEDPVSLCTRVYWILPERTSPGVTPAMQDCSHAPRVRFTEMLWTQSVVVMLVESIRGLYSCFDTLHKMQINLRSNFLFFFHLPPPLTHFWTT